MNKPALMHSADCIRERDRDAQELRYFQWSAEQSIERLASGVLEHQRHAIILATQRDWPRRPGSIKFSLERKFMFEPLDAPERRVFRSDKQNRRQPVAGAPVEDELPLPQRREHIARKLHRKGLLPRCPQRNFQTQHEFSAFASSLKTDATCGTCRNLALKCGLTATSSRGVCRIAEPLNERGITALNLP
jgi:hypothetical protein